MNSPAVNRKVLLILAGIVWTMVGLGLSAAAVYWLNVTDGNWILALSVGLVAGLIVYRFGFLRLVQENKVRLMELAEGKDKVCIFAFQSWRSYIIVVVMMAMGYTLRHLPVSKIYLSPVYMAIGIGLLLASLHYYTSSQ